MLYALILAGGVGSRLWPKSRNSMPKQFLNLTGIETMIQTTVRRILPIIPPERIFVVTGQRYTELVQEQLPQLPQQNIIAEISGKNTAPAIGLGAVHVAQQDADATIAVLTADHIIPNEDAFRQALLAATQVAADGRLVTLGITPTGPETGFGYIHRGEQIGCFEEQPAYEVAAFLEKPELATAQKFFESGEYYWNSGMFIWQVGTLFNGFATHMPALSTSLAQLKEAIFRAEASASVAELWQQVTSESIDFGLMEKAQNVAMVPLDAGWNDVGSWAALYEELAGKADDSVSVNAEHISIDCQRVLVQGNGKMIATIGVNNIAIVETEDAILVCDLDKTQDVKKVVERLKAEKRDKFL